MGGAEGPGDAMALVMVAILLRTGRQEVDALVDALAQIDMDEIDEIVAENLEEQDEAGGGRQ